MAIQWIAGDTFTCLSTDTKPSLVPANTKAIETDTDDTYKFNGTSWALFSGAGGGGGLSAGGQISFSGNASQTVFNIPHGLSQTPDFVSIEPASTDAFGSFTTTKTSSNIVITYQIPPPLGSSNVTFQWGAGDVGAATGGLTATSTTTFTNKTMSPADNTFFEPNASTWVIYKSGSNYKAKNSYLGYTPTAAISTSLDTVWAYLRASTFDQAGVSDPNYGGTIEFTRGIFTFTGIADIDNTFPGVGGTAAIRVKGQGFGTRLQFSPAATSDAGFRINGTGANFCGIEDMRVLGNNNVTNIIRINGNAQRSVLKNLDIRNSTSTIVTGQKGILVDTTVADAYYTYFNNLHFRYLDYAFDAINLPNALFLDTFEMWDCNKGIHVTGGLHNIVNMKMQASATVGDYVVDVDANYCNVANISVDGMTKAGAYAVIVEPGRISYSIVNVNNSGGMTNCISDLSLHAHRRVLVSNVGFDLNSFMRYPSIGRKVGVWAGQSSTLADGLLMAGFVLMKDNAGTSNCTPTALHDTTHGEGQKFTTLTAEIGANAGIRSANLLTQASHNPRLKLKFKLAQTTNSRGFLGLIGSVASDFTGNTPLATLGGMGLGWRSTDTAFHAAHQSASAGTTFDPLTGTPAIDTAVHTIEIIGSASPTAWSISFDGGAAQAMASQMTAAALGIQVGVEASLAESKSLDLFYIELEANS